MGWVDWINKKNFLNLRANSYGHRIKSCAGCGKYKGIKQIIGHTGTRIWACRDCRKRGI